MKIRPKEVLTRAVVDYSCQLAEKSDGSSSYSRRLLLTEGGKSEKKVEQYDFCEDYLMFKFTVMIGIIGSVVLQTNACRVEEIY